MSRERLVPRLSIIIPWCGGTAAFEDTLVSVLQNRPPQSEILVLHSHVYDDPYNIGDDGVQLIERRGASEIELINSGFSLARARVVHVLRCGFEVQPGWSESALKYFENPRVACASPIVLDRRNTDRLAAVGVQLSRSGARQVCGHGRCLHHLPAAAAHVIGPTLSAGFYRRDDVLAIDGFDDVVGPFADVDLALTLRHFGFECAVASECRIFGIVDPWVAGGFRTGRQLEQVFWRHSGPSIGSGQKLMHACTIVARLLAQFPSPRMISELSGRIVGLLERKHYRQFRELINQVRPREIKERKTLRRLAA